MVKSTATDILDGLRRADLWVFMGWHDVRQRYRRSTLGPFWITLATVIFIGLMTLVYSGLFNQSIADFLPLVGTGLIVWTLIAGCIGEGTNVFISAATVIKQIAAPLPVHVFRLLWQQFIYFLHNVVVLVVIVLAVGVPVNGATLLVFPALALVMLNMCWMVLLLGSLGARYRDVPTTVQSFLPALFIVTPVMWQVSYLPPGRQWVAYANPLTYLIEVVRLPVLGIAPSANVWGACLAMAAVGWLLAMYVYGRARTRVAYWL
jgi:ABC-type polysaccharide/polyol phosphate export permease